MDGIEEGQGAGREYGDDDGTEGDIFEPKVEVGVPEVEEV